MAAASATTFDAQEFAGLIAKFDCNPSEAEAMTAIRTARRKVKNEGLRVCDVLEWPEVKAAIDRQLEPVRHPSAELAAVKAELEDAKEGGDVLAEALEKANDTIAEFRKAEEARRRFCRSCETLRRYIALLIGSMILAAWLYAFPPQDFGLMFTGYGVLLAAAPLVVLVIRWAVLCFKQKHAWVSWRDNNIFRAVANRWNSFLQRILERLILT